MIIAFLIVIFFYYYLRQGVAIDNLRVGNFKIEGLYLKLDNKLKLKIDTFTVPKDSKQKVDVEKTIGNIKKALKYFEYVDLENVKYTNDSYRVIISNDVIYIDNSKYEFAGVVTPSKGLADVDVSVLRIKKYNLDLSGKIKYSYDKDDILFNGMYKIFGSEGNASIHKIGNDIDFSIDNSGIKSVLKIVDLMDMSKTDRVWLRKKTAAKLYKIIHLKGRAKLKNGKFELYRDGMVGDFLLEDARVRLKPTLEVLHSKAVNIKLHNNIMEIFAPDGIEYKNKHLSVSNVKLTNIIGKKSSKFMMRFKLHSRYDDVVKSFLSAYDIASAISQVEGSTQAAVDLTIDTDSGQTDINATATISKGKLKLSDTEFATRGGDIGIRNHMIYLKKINLYDKNYDLNIKGSVDSRAKKAELKVDVRHLNIGSPNGIHLSVNNLKKVPLAVNFAKNVIVAIPIYKFTANIGTHHRLDLSVKRLGSILPYIKGLPIAVKGGNIQIKTDNGRRYTFTGNTIWGKSYLYKKAPITKIDFSGTFSKNSLIFKALNGNFKYISKISTIYINNINVDLKKLSDSYAGTISKNSGKITIVGKNNILRYEKYALLDDSFRAELNKKKISFVASKDGDKLEIEKSGNHIDIYADRIKDRMLKSLIHFGGLTGGRYSMLLTGNLKGTMKGIIKVKGGIINSFKAYNNTIALLNTIPALMTFQNPGYSEKGFEINDGQIKFRLENGKIIFDDMLINGKSSTIAGKGRVYTKSGKLDIDLAIRTARGIGKVLGSLPLVGYIFFGKDKSITTGVKVTGTLDKPVVKTHPVLDTLLYPLKVIKRTIESPAHIINK